MGKAKTLILCFLMGVLVGCSSTPVSEPYLDRLDGVIEDGEDTEIILRDQGNDNCQTLGGSRKNCEEDWKE